MIGRPARAVAVLSFVAAASCLTPGEEHLTLDRKVGKAEVDGAHFEEVDGLAAIRTIQPGEVRLWAASPVLHLEARLAPSAAPGWEIIVENAMPAAELAVQCPDEATCGATSLDSARATVARWEVTLAPGATTELRVAPPDWDEATPFRFAALSDIQKGLPEVHEIFARMNRDDSLRFVISTGDLTHRGSRGELEDFQAQLETLDVPFFTTYGNHEAVADPLSWHELFGPFNPRFRFKEVFFSLIDSSASSIDPAVYDVMRPWLAASRDEVHVFATHVPPLEPHGTRSVAFRSRAEAAKLISMLADARVDLAVFGHIHTFESYSTGGIPAYVSGGGGGNAERLDGIGRHYLAVDVTPGVAIDQVGVVRIDDD